jgi:hypothetical protein
LLRLQAQALHHCQGVPVSPDEDVLPVVQRERLSLVHDLQPTRASAGLTGSLKQLNLPAPAHEFDCGHASGPARANNSHSHQ